MRIVDEPLLASFRSAPSCEWCNRPNRTGLEPHHIFCRGMRGEVRLDVRINLVSLCRECHQKFHDGNIKRTALMKLAAVREKTTLAALESEIYRLRRLPKPIGGSTGAGD